MSANEFWKDDPQLFVSYRTSFINKKKRELEELDYKCWLQGLYNYEGNGKLFMSLKQFIGNIVAGLCKGSKDHTKIEPYSPKPLTELQKEKKQKELDKIKNFEQFQQDFVYFGTIKQRYLENLKKKGDRK